jgi:hypothetical protein
VYLGNVIAPAVGPTGVRIVQNTFDNVYAEGIVIVNVGLNASAYNTFYDVGNWFQGTTSPVTPVIDINGNNNVSVGDMFERTTQYADALRPRIKLNNLNGIALGMNVSNIVFYESNVADLTVANQIAVGTYQRTAGTILQPTWPTSAEHISAVFKWTTLSFVMCIDDQAPCQQSRDRQHWAQDSHTLTTS